MNERLYYDATDTTSEENGFSVFVTPNGARWKADVSEGYNVFLAGFSPSENNLAQCIHKINAWIVAKAIVASRINDRKATILIPGLIDSGGATVYTMTEDVHFCAALVELVPLTLQFWDFSSSFDVPILCSNEFEDYAVGWVTATTVEQLTRVASLSTRAASSISKAAARIIRLMALSWEPYSPP